MIDTYLLIKAESRLVKVPKSNYKGKYASHNAPYAYRAKVVKDLMIKYADVTLDHLYSTLLDSGVIPDSDKLMLKKWIDFTKGQLK